MKKVAVFLMIFSLIFTTALLSEAGDESGRLGRTRAIDPSQMDKAGNIFPFGGAFSGDNIIITVPVPDSGPVPEMTPSEKAAREAKMKSLRRLYDEGKIMIA